MNDESPFSPAEPFSPTELRDHRWWVARFGVDDPRRAPIYGVDPRDLASAGWGVIFAPDVGPEEREALRPLLEHRRSQAGPFFKLYEYASGMTKHDFLARQNAPPGPADPRHVPYYLLLVGDPRTIPFRFQYELDIQYGVGRICFDRPEDYSVYAQSVVRAETGPPARPQRLTFFAVTHDNDHGTQRTAQDLVEPLVEALSADNRDWDVRSLIGPAATKKEQLVKLLGGQETPAVLFTASHGLAFTYEEKDPRQFLDQGALVCGDWPGPSWEGGVPPNFYVSAQDIVEDADLQGLVVFQFASYGGGTPEHESVIEDDLGGPKRLAPYPFIARLPQRLLSHPRGGALAVVSLIDRGWTYSFSWTSASQIQMFESALNRLLDGYPVGSAMEYFNQRYAELSVELSSLWEDRQSSLEVSRSRFERIWRAMNDARSFVVLGDPAVRLSYRKA